MAGIKKKSSNNDFDAIVAEVEAERNAAPELKPVEDQYDLIAGYTDENGVLHDTFTIRPMDGEDEEVLARYQNSNTMHKATSMLLERCVLSIGSISKESVKKTEWHDIIQNLYAADQDAILLRIREVSVGDDVQARHKCGDCGAMITTSFNVDDLEIIEWNGEDGIVFDLPKGYTDKEGNVHKVGILRYPRGIDREVIIPAASKNPARGRTLYLARLMKFDDGTPVNEGVLKKLTLGDRNYLSKLLEDNQFGIDNEIEIECPDCGNIFKGTLSITNFLG